VATARIQVEFLDPKDAQRRLAQIAQAEQRLNTQFKGGFITSEKLRKSTERLSRAKALLTRRLNTNSASLRRGTRAAATMTTTLGSLRSIALSVGVTFGAWQVARILGSALETAGQFERGMNRIRALAQTTRAEFKLLEDQAKTLGRTTQFSATQATDAMGFLAQTGFDANQIYAAMPATLNLAAAAQLDLGSAADIVSNVMKGFRFDVDEVNRSVDVLTGAFTGSNTNLVQLGQALKKVGPVARRFNIDFEEMVAVVSALGDAGIQGGEAGTAARRIILNLINTASDFGIQIRDLTTGKLLPFVDILRNIEAAALGDEEAIKLFGARAIAAGSILLSSIPQIEANTAALKDNAGAAEEVRKIQEEGLIGATKEMTSAWEGLQIALVDTKGFIAAQRGLASLLRSVTDFLEEREKLADRLEIASLLHAAFPEEDVRQIRARTLAFIKRLEETGKAAQDTKKEVDKLAGDGGGGLGKLTEEEEKTRKALEEFQDSLSGRALRGLFAFNDALDATREGLKGLSGEMDLGPAAMRLNLSGIAILDLERDLAIQRAQLAGDTVTAIVLQEERRVEETLAGLEKIGAGSKDLARARIVLEAQTAVKLAAENKRAFEQMAQQIDFFFQRAALGAQSFSDLFKQIWTQLLSFFISQVSRMVAAWVLGQKQMQAASAGGGGGGGGIGSILGGIFGGGSIFGTARAPGGTGTFSGAPIGSNLVSGGGGLASFGVPGIGVPSGLPPPPPGSATGIEGQAGLLGMLGIKLQGIGPISGGILASAGILAALFGIRTGRPLVGALGGAAAGFAFGGPIGAVIGAIVGGVAAVFSRGKLKRRAAASEEAFSAQLVEVVAQFKKFELDFQGALDTVDQLFADFSVVAPQQFGRFGRRAVRNITPFVRAVKDRIREIQGARDVRAALSIFGQIPEFTHGGLVPSLLHPGEFVIRREAVQRVGVQNLERVNAGQTPMGNVNINITINPSPGMDERAVGEMAARAIARRFRNRGLQFGG